MRSTGPHRTPSPVSPTKRQGKSRSPPIRGVQVPSDHIPVDHALSSASFHLTLSLKVTNEELKFCVETLTSQFQATPMVQDIGEYYIPVVYTGVNSMKELLEYQRVITEQKRPCSMDKDALLDARVSFDFANGGTVYLLNFSRNSQDDLYAFSSGIVMRLASFGIASRILVQQQHDIALVALEKKLANRDVAGLTWKGNFEWNQIVVTSSSGSFETPNQIVSLPSVAAALKKTASFTPHKEITQLVNGMLLESSRKYVTILRGIPGSGKSSLGREIAALCRERGISCVICSADFYFETPRGYEFDIKKIGMAHENSQATFQRALRAKTRVVIVDNTNTQMWEYEKYIEFAAPYDYDLRILEVKCPDTLTALRAAQRNSHGVPMGKVLTMHDRWEEDPRVCLSIPPCFDQDFDKSPISSNQPFISYVGLFLTEVSKQVLLQAVPPRFAQISAEHVTIFFKPSMEYLRRVLIGKQFTVYATHAVHDTKGQTVSVILEESSAESSKFPLHVKNEFPHVTLSTAPTVQNQYSNELLAKSCGEVNRISLINESVVELKNGIRCEAVCGVQFSANGRNTVLQSNFFAKQSVIECHEHIRKVVILSVNLADLPNWILSFNSSVNSQLHELCHAQCHTRRVLLLENYDSDMNSRWTQVQNAFAKYHLPFDQVLHTNSENGNRDLEDSLNQIVFDPLHTNVTKVTLLAQNITEFVGPVQQVSLSNSHVAWCLHQVVLPEDQAKFQQRYDLDHALNLTNCFNFSEYVHHLVAQTSQLLEKCMKQLYPENFSQVSRIDTSLDFLETPQIDLWVKFTGALNNAEPLKTRSTQILNFLRQNGLVHVSSSFSPVSTAQQSVPYCIYFQHCTKFSWSPIFRLYLDDAQAGSVDSNPLKRRMAFCNVHRTATCPVLHELHGVLVRLVSMILTTYFSTSSIDGFIIQFLVEQTVQEFIATAQNLSKVKAVDELNYLNQVNNFLVFLKSYSNLQWEKRFEDLENQYSFKSSLSQKPKWFINLEKIIQVCVDCFVVNRYGNGRFQAQVFIEQLRQQIQDVARQQSHSVQYFSIELLNVNELSQSSSRLFALQLCEVVQCAALKLGDQLEGGSFHCQASFVSSRVEIKASSTSLMEHLLVQAQLLMESTASCHDAFGVDSLQLALRQDQNDEIISFVTVQLKKISSPPPPRPASPPTTAIDTMTL